jgi:hypothetical protein
MKKLLGMLLMSGVLVLPVAAAASNCCDQSKSATQSQTGSATVQSPTTEAQPAKPQVKPETAKQPQGEQKTQTPSQKEIK